MENPFEFIFEKLDWLERLLLELSVRLVNCSTDQINATNQLAEYLAVSFPTIYSLTSKREVPLIKMGKRGYFRKTLLTHGLIKVG